MVTVVKILTDWFAGIGNSFNFFFGIVRLFWTGIGNFITMFVDLPTFLVAFIGLGVFCVFANIVLKII